MPRNGTAALVGALVVTVPSSAWAGAPPEATGPVPEAAPAVPEAPAVLPANRNLVIAGNVVTGLGGAGFITMAVGLLVAAEADNELGFANVGDDPDRAQRLRQRRQTGQIIGLVGGVSAGVLLAAGITLMAVGYRRERLRREALEAQARWGRGGVWVSPSGASLSWRVSF